MQARARSGSALRGSLVAAIVTVAALAGAARAQPIAAPPDRPAARAAERPDPHPPAGLGGGLTVGRAGMPGVEAGWLVRIEYEVFPVLAPSGLAGPIVGFHVGWEFWRSPADWNLGLPVAVVLGVRAQPVRATIGVGVEAITVDSVDDDRGVGLYAPMASARVGADIFGFQLGADARIVRRWLIGAPDHTQWQLGAFIAKTWDGRDRRPRY